MTDEQMRIAIAEACERPGPHWWCPGCLCEKSPVQVTCNETCTLCGAGVEWHDIPDYLNDLNAMHEAEKSLTEEQLELYTYWLSHSCGLGTYTRATAAQRAEAFLRTLNLWEEERHD